MSDFERRFRANAEQAAYWNEQAGPKWARNDAAMDARLRPLSEELLRRASPRPGERVLDVGCGAGATTARLAEAVGPGGRVLGLDLSEPLLALARARCADLAQVELEHADAQVHPFAPESVDLALSRFGVMFFDDPYAAFANLRRAVRAGGRLHFVCWAPLERNPWFTVPLEVAARHLGAPAPPSPRAPGPLAFSEPDYVADILERGGWRAPAIDPVETALESAAPVDEQAALYLTLGPAARLVAAAEPGPDTLARLTEDMIRALETHRAGDTVRLGATVYYVSAEA